MTEQDCQQVYQDLADLLQSLQLGWVVEQVESSPHTIGAMGYDQPAVIINGPALSLVQAVLTKPVTHTAQNQLIRLIDAAQRVVVDTTEMEGALVDFLAEVGQHLPTPLTLGFASEDSQALIQSVEVSPDRRQAVAELRPLLQALRQEASSGVN